MLQVASNNVCDYPSVGGAYMRQRGALRAIAPPMHARGAQRALSEVSWLRSHS